MNKKKLLGILIGIVIIIADQLLKQLLIGQNFTALQGILNITYTENTGVAFGIGSSNIVIVIILNIIVLGLIIKFLKQKTDSPIIIPLIMILAGGTSNLLDRIIRGFVIDFIDINLFNFPNFNIADIAITIGVFALAIQICKKLGK